ncbi:hypothetical protein HHK36_013977 [Tetracentron sinense]|uniref:Kinesin motor domain-containing protein n=1 Tax=Tetracentron sinense TaxID=13715 RepID=A0A834Z778_TETSI|nr:hypothetical protein HHK36_013977 [Tetracentron sinense]
MMILTFLRLRTMAKKEKEVGSRCCGRIVNRRDVYLTEFATENDYLQLKRLCGRHFTFDASFPDSTTQQEVYSTTYIFFLIYVVFTSYLKKYSSASGSSFEGRNGSVFCYGATGAGKTILGTMENPG